MDGSAAPTTGGLVAAGARHRVTFTMFGFGLGWNMKKRFPPGTQVVVCGRLEGPTRTGVQLRLGCAPVVAPLPQLAPCFAVTLRVRLTVSKLLR